MAFGRAWRQETGTALGYLAHFLHLAAHYLDGPLLHVIGFQVRAGPPAPSVPPVDLELKPNEPIFSPITASFVCALRYSGQV